jgi:hypothetical protein
MPAKRKPQTKPKPKAKPVPLKPKKTYRRDIYGEPKATA